jgi:hypothetical protein
VCVIGTLPDRREVLIPHVKRTLGLEASGLCIMTCHISGTCGGGVDTDSPRLRLGVGVMKRDCRVPLWTVTCIGAVVSSEP